MDNSLVQLSLDIPVVFTLQSSNKRRDKLSRFLQSGKEQLISSCADRILGRGGKIGQFFFSKVGVFQGVRQV